MWDLKQDGWLDAVETITGPLCRWTFKSAAELLDFLRVELTENNVLPSTGSDDLAPN